MPKVKKKIEETATQPAQTPSVFPAAVETVTVTKETLDATPGRALTFLRAVGTIASVRAALRKRGYTTEENARGWRLLHKTAGFTGEAPSESDGDVMQALAEIDAWDEPNLGLASAALKHRHPDQYAFVFEKLQPARGAESVLVVTRFLDRLDALESSPERADTRAADRAALDTLAQRGVTPRERARMRELLAKVENLVEDDAPEEDVTSPDVMDAALRELRAFYEEWSAVARIVITRRDHLIRMGLAHRKQVSPASDPEGDPDPEPGTEPPKG